MIALILVGSPALAQRRTSGPPDTDRREDPEFAPDRGPGGPPSAERREEIRKKIEAIRIWRLTEELKLDPDTSGKLSALLSSIERKRRDIQREQMETMTLLRQTLKSQKPEEDKMKQYIEKLQNNHRAMQELRNDELKGVKAILTVEQQARFLVFQQDFQREMRETITNARGGGQGSQRPGQGDSGRNQGMPDRRDFRGKDGAREPYGAPRY